MSLVIFVLLLLGLWQLISYILIDVFHVFKIYQMPSPIGVFESFVELMKNGRIIQALIKSMERGFIGFFIAIIIGFTIGLLINRIDYFQKNLRPIILGVQTLPSVCWVPFSILWFGLTDYAILFVVIMGATFSIAIAVDGAIKNVLPIYLKVALTLGVNNKQLFFQVIIPAIIPDLISCLKQGWAFAWRALMAGEVMTSSIGLGQTLIIGRDLADINQVALVMIIIVIIGVSIDKYIFSIIEKKILMSRGMILK